MKIEHNKSWERDCWEEIETIPHKIQCQINENDVQDNEKALDTH